MVCTASDIEWDGPKTANLVHRSFCFGVSEMAGHEGHVMRGDGFDGGVYGVFIGTFSCWTLYSSVRTRVYFYYSQLKDCFWGAGQ